VGQFSANYTLPDNTFVAFETRSSDDGLAWDNWVAVSNEQVFGTNHVFKINSTPNGYIQVRATLSSSDRIFSPLITEYSIGYYQDMTEPTNPSAVSAYTSAAKATGIATNTWYNHAAPHFEWPAVDAVGGATDGVGGSGVAGYYVYFGIDSNADPVTFQTTNTYTASGLSAGQTYYLKIMTEDNAGMITASSYSAFTYKFDNIAPTNPTIISVNPTGYTAVDNFIFTWSSDAADSFSGISKLQYRTDGDVADTWTDIANPADITVTIPNADHLVGAYQSGKNKFYLRAVDAAGNVQRRSCRSITTVRVPRPRRRILRSLRRLPRTTLLPFLGISRHPFVGDSTKLVYHVILSMCFRHRKQYGLDSLDGCWSRGFRDPERRESVLRRR
jgi:hypothetical protein